MTDMPEVDAVPPGRAHHLCCDDTGPVLGAAEVGRIRITASSGAFRRAARAARGATCGRAR